ALPVAQPSLPARSPAVSPQTPQTQMPQTETPQTETLLSFQTGQYAVKIFRQQGILRLNLYNRQTNQVELRGMPMQQAVTDTGIIYTNLQGEALYSVMVAPDGSAYWLKIQQGDRVTYNERVQHVQAAEAAPADHPPSGMRPSDAPVRQQAASRPGLDDTTLANFQTRKYVVRIYDQNGELRMNVYNKQSDRVELRAAPVRLNYSGSSTTYSNPNGERIYSVRVSPAGNYHFLITQKDRIVYNERGY
ncbi:MAG TPA: hypothetical protein V6C57_09840, partial [Coleofasciculaceae cyanobacterium]